MRHIVTILILSVSIQLQAREGVNTAIDSSRLEEVRGYLNNAKVDLESGLSYVKDVPIKEKEAYLASTMEQVLSNSFGQNEFLMRNVLHRTKVIYDELLKTPASPKRDKAARRILEENIKKALSLYQMDERLLENTDYVMGKIKPVDFAIVGIGWTDYVLDRYIDLPTNESRLNVMAASLGLLYNDILDDMKFNRLLAPVAQHIETFYNLNKDKIEELQRARGDGTKNMEKLKMARKIFGFLQREVEVMQSLLEDVEGLAIDSRYLRYHPKLVVKDCSKINLKKENIGVICETSFGGQFERVENGIKELESGLVIMDEIKTGVNQYVASNYCEKKGLRLPTESEFDSIIRKGLKEAFAGDMHNKYFWSSTMSTINQNHVRLAFNFFDSDIVIDYDHLKNDFNYAARCVRGGGVE